MSRIKFPKGEQRQFLKQVIVKINSPSLKELSQRLNLNYSTLKSYYAENRLLPQQLFNDLIIISKIENPKIKILDEYWGKSKGGKKSKRK